MVSLGVMMVGAMAIIHLQALAVRANVQARKLSIGTQIAQRWIERLKQDTQRWNQVAVAGGTPTDVTVLSNTRFLSAINNAPGVFQSLPTVPDDAISNAFTYRGADRTVGMAAPIEYCASFRPSWVYFGRAMRVDVRVWWATDQGGNIITDFPGCADDNATLNRVWTPPADGNPLYGRYRIVYLSTVLRVVPTWN